MYNRVREKNDENKNHVKCLNATRILIDFLSGKKLLFIVSSVNFRIFLKHFAHFFRVSILIILKLFIWITNNYKRNFAEILMHFWWNINENIIDFDRKTLSIWKISLQISRYNVIFNPFDQMHLILNWFLTLSSKAIELKCHSSKSKYLVPFQSKSTALHWPNVKE